MSWQVECQSQLGMNSHRCVPATVSSFCVVILACDLSGIGATEESLTNCMVEQYTKHEAEQLNPADDSNVMNQLTDYFINYLVGMLVAEPTDQTAEALGRYLGDLSWVR